MLHLERPLVFFDLEATGTDPQEARVIQIGMQRFVPAPNGAALDDLTPPPKQNGGTESLTMQFRWAHDSEFDTSVSGVNNDYRFDQFDRTGTMALHQDASQDL